MASIKGILISFLKFKNKTIFLGGGELTHIFCTINAAIPIKSYSPECIVHPLLDTSEEKKTIEEN